MSNDVSFYMSFSKLSQKLQDVLVCKQREFNKNIKGKQRIELKIHLNNLVEKNAHKHKSVYVISVGAVLKMNASNEMSTHGTWRN